MKKNIGATLALYPTPLVVVGAMVNGKPNWMLAGHVGIIGHDRIMVSCAKPHLTNEGIKASGIVSVNSVDQALLKKADYVGSVSGRDHDKSAVFAWTLADGGAPLVAESPLTMGCTVVDTYQTEGFESFILKIDATYADENILDASGKIDYRKLKPVLFEMPTYEYLGSGEVLGRCRQLWKEQ